MPFFVEEIRADLLTMCTFLMLAPAFSSNSEW